MQQEEATKQLLGAIETGAVSSAQIHDFAQSRSSQSRLLGPRISSRSIVLPNEVSSMTHLASLVTLCLASPPFWLTQQWKSFLTSLPDLILLQIVLASARRKAATSLCRRHSLDLTPEAAQQLWLRVLEPYVGLLADLSPKTPLESEALLSVCLFERPQDIIRVPAFWSTTELYLGYLRANGKSLVLLYTLHRGYALARRVVDSSLFDRLLFSPEHSLQESRIRAQSRRSVC